MDQLKFICKQCDHDVVRRIRGTTLMRCSKCGFEGEPKQFKVAKRPSLKWDEAREVRPYE